MLMVKRTEMITVASPIIIEIIGVDSLRIGIVQRVAISAERYNVVIVKYLVRFILGVG
jgi:hypothetical protein